MGPRVMRHLPKYVHGLHRPAWQDRATICSRLGFPPHSVCPACRGRRNSWRPTRKRLPGQPTADWYLASEAGHISRARRGVTSPARHFEDKAAKAPQIHLSQYHRSATAPSMATSGPPSCTASMWSGSSPPAPTSRERANALRRSLRALMQHAVEIGMRADDPTRDVRAIASQGSTAITLGRKPRFRSSSGITRWARGRGWLFALLLYSGQRRSGTWSAWAVSIFSDGALFVRQQKTGREVWDPGSTQRLQQSLPRRPAEQPDLPSH